MATFYIDSPEYGVLELTSTTSIKVVDTTTLAKHKLESGREIVDNAVNNNKQISFNGIISQIRKLSVGLSDARGNQINNSGNIDPVQKYINTLYKIRDEKLSFSVIYDSRFPAAKDCMITSLTKDRDSSTGTSYNISLSLEQYRFSTAANITVERDNQVNPDLTQDVTNSDGSNTEEAGPALTLLGGGLAGITGLPQLGGD